MSTLERCIGQDQKGPDPLLLLQGVQSSREQIPPSRLKIKYAYCDSLITNTIVVYVDFDGILRSFKHVRPNNELISDWCTVFDGSKAITYEKRINQVSYRSIMSPASQLMLFDPRLLGLINAYAWNESLDVAVPCSVTNANYELIGREQVDGKEAWHVRFSTTKYLQIDYWIDDKRDFRVYRRDWNGVQTRSYYENEKYPRLPSRIVSKAYTHLKPIDKEKPTYEKDLQILEASAFIRFKEDRWNLAKMNIEPGADVVDYRLSRSIGTWNGNRIVSESDGSRSPLGLWSYGIVFALFVVPGIYLWRVKRSGTR